MSKTLSFYADEKTVAIIEQKKADYDKVDDIEFNLSKYICKLITQKGDKTVVKQ